MRRHQHASTKQLNSTRLCDAYCVVTKNGSTETAYTKKLSPGWPRWVADLGSSIKRGAPAAGTLGPFTVVPPFFFFLSSLKFYLAPMYVTHVLVQLFPQAPWGFRRLELEADIRSGHPCVMGRNESHFGKNIYQRSCAQSPTVHWREDRGSKIVRTNN